MLLDDLARDRLVQGIAVEPLLERAEPWCAAARKYEPGSIDSVDIFAEWLDMKARSAALSGGDPLPFWQRAETELAAAVKLDPKREDIRSDVVFFEAGRAEYLHAQGKSAAASLARALSEAQLAVQTNPESGVAQRALAAAHLAAARTTPNAKAVLEGEKAAERALAINGDDVAALLIAAELRLHDARAGRPASPGQTLVARGLAMNPTHARLLLLRAMFERLAQDNTHADADLAAALKIGPLLQQDPLLR
jgi:hypothetical protein